MEIKKSFKLIEDHKEEEFLNQKQAEGYTLVGFDGLVYQFEETKKKDQRYLIEFYYEALSKDTLKRYLNKKYELVLTYKSSGGGYYYYFRTITEHERDIDNDRILYDRNQLVQESKSRFDKFSIVLLVSSFTLFSYMYFKYNNNIYFIVLGLIVLVASYLANIYIETIKKLKSYKEIIESNEGSN